MLLSTKHPEDGEVIQLLGDQRKGMCQFLVWTGPRTVS